MTPKHLRFVLAPACLIAGLLIAGESLAQDNARQIRVLTAPSGSACDSSYNFPSFPSGGGCDLNAGRSSGVSPTYDVTRTWSLPPLGGETRQKYDFASRLPGSDPTRRDIAQQIHQKYGSGALGATGLAVALMVGDKDAIAWPETRVAHASQRYFEAYARFRQTDEYRKLNARVVQANRANLDAYLAWSSIPRKATGAEGRTDEALERAARLRALMRAMIETAHAQDQALSALDSAFERFAPDEIKEQADAEKDLLFHSSLTEGDDEGPTKKPTVDSATKQADGKVINKGINKDIDELLAPGVLQGMVDIS